MDWKDTLLPGASRTPLPWDGVLLPGWVLDTYGPWTERNDWTAGPGGRPVISGSSEQQGGPMVPSPGFEPVEPGVYGGQVFTGRGGGAAAASVIANPVIEALLEQGAPPNHQTDWQSSSPYAPPKGQTINPEAVMNAQKPVPNAIQQALMQRQLQTRRKAPSMSPIHKTLFAGNLSGGGLARRPL